MTAANDPYVDHMINGASWPFSYEDLEAEHERCRQTREMMEFCQQNMHIAVKISEVVRKITQFRYSDQYKALDDEAKNDIDWSIDYATNLMGTIAGLRNASTAAYKDFLRALNIVWEGMALSSLN